MTKNLLLGIAAVCGSTFQAVAYGNLADIP